MAAREVIHFPFWAQLSLRPLPLTLTPPDPARCIGIAHDFAGVTPTNDKSPSNKDGSPSLLQALCHQLAGAVRPSHVKTVGSSYQW
jgi:hypothetical protein